MTFIHIKHKSIGSNVYPLILNLGSVPTCTRDEDNGDKVADCSTSGVPSPMALFFPTVSGTDRCINSRLPTTVITLES